MRGTLLPFCLASIAAGLVPACTGSINGTPFTIGSSMDGLRIPSPSDECTPVVFDGREYCLYDVDGDDIPDWVWDPQRRRYARLTWPAGQPYEYAVLESGGADSSGDWLNRTTLRIIDGIIRAAFDGEPDQSWPMEHLTAEEAIDRFMVQTSAPLRGLADVQWSIPENGFQAGTLDVRLPLVASADAPILIPDPLEHETLAFEIAMIPSNVGPLDFVALRLAGPPAAVQDYLVRLGVTDVRIAGSPDAPAPLPGARVR